jgi:hypothetical protein
MASTSPRRLFAVLTSLGIVIPLAALAVPAQATPPGRAPAASARQDDGPGGVPDKDARFGAGRYHPTAAQKQALKKLGKDVVATWSHTGTAHSLVSAGSALSGPSKAKPDSVARSFVAQQKELFGLSRSEVDALRLTRNDADSSGATFLRYQQVAQGRDVFGATLLVSLDSKGRVLIAGGNLVPDATAPAATLSAADAVAVAGDDLNPGAANRAGKQLADKGATHRFANTLKVPDYQGAAPVGATLVNVATAAGVRAAWQVHADVASNAAYVELVDARTGAVLYRKNQVASDTHGTVFPGDDPEAGGRSQQDFPDPWVDDGTDTTSGNNADAYQDAVGDNTADSADQPHNSDQHFDYPWTDTWGNGTGQETDLPLSGDDRDAAVTQMFYYTNWYHDYVYGLGFTEAWGNFQNDNAGNGGDDGDAVLAESDDSFTGTQCKDSNNNDIKCLNNANFNTNGGDGNHPRMQMYVGMDGNPVRYTQRANNRDTIIHEYTHGVSGRIISDDNLAGDLQSGALGEGWSDALATSINNDPVYGEYNNGNYTNGIRSTAYDANTYDYGDICTIARDNANNPVCEVHADGEVWATIMWEVRESLIAKYGQGTGKDKHEHLMISGMKFTPDTPSFADARNGYLIADYLQNPTGTFLVGENYCRLWKVFGDDELGTGSNDSDNDSSPTVNTDTPGACAPTASIAAVPDTPEGTDITFDSSASAIGGDPGDTLSYAWDLDNDGAFDDSTSASPVWAYGDNAARTVGLTVTNSAGYSATTSVSFNTTNVTPSVSVDLSDLVGMEEGDTRTVNATFSDPGWLDTYTGNVDLGTSYRPDVTPTLAITTAGAKGAGDIGGATPDQGTATADVTYGDNGTYTITVEVTDDDGALGSDHDDAIVANVDPTSVIDTGGEQTYDGVSAFILEAGEDLTIPASSEDPGSDDLTFVWDWDGLLSGETPDQEISLVDGPGTDPALSPSIDPRDVDLSKTHAYGDACLYNLSVSVTDDDGGSSTDTAVVLVTGNATVSKGHGWWLNEYRPKSANDFTPAQLQCYLDIANYMSMVFSEKTPALTRAQATKILNAPAKAPEAVIFDQMALGAWLNFANGSIKLDSPVDSNGDGITDSTFGAVMFTAETVRINPASTSAQIKAQKTIVERIALQSAP